MIPNTLAIVEEYVNRGTLLPSYLLTNKETHEIIKKSGKYPVVDLKELEEAVKILEVTYDTLFLSANPFSPFVYIQDFTYVDISSLDKGYLDLFKIKETIKQQTQTLASLRKQGKYADIIILTGKKYLLNVFHEAYDEIPENQKYQVFKETYTAMEYGFQAFRPEILEEVLTLNLDKTFKEALTTDEKGYVVVYRGEGSKSRGLEEAYSWTTERKVAQFFAKRFDKAGKVYQGKVHIDDVIDFIDNRNESEILVKPENVKEIVKL